MTDTTAHPLTLYNSLTRQKEQFVPQDPIRVTMYNCGPTVYSYAHIGNARAAVVADVLFRVLRQIYGEEAVVYARNITDVDDKIIAAAQEQGVSISEITQKYARIYKEDLAALNCLPPTVQPKATEHIQQMADIIVTLMDKDIAYEGDGHILFDVTKDADYGKLSGRSQEDNRAGARVEVASYKRNAGDFVLWKPAKDGEPGWSQQESQSNYKVDWRKYGNRPFAVTPGRPGWHIECSAMAKATLGETIDIHCGGIDLKFPHHENEIAQSECANEKEFSKFWVHNEFLNMGSEKMSKSLGNVTLVHDLLKEWDGEVIRLALLKAHYRSELNWSEDLLRESKAQLDDLYGYKLLETDVKHNGVDQKMLGLFANDLGIPSAFAELAEWLSGPFEIRDEQSRVRISPKLKKNRVQNSKLDRPSSIKGARALHKVTRVFIDVAKSIGPMAIIYSDQKRTIINTLNLIGLLQKDPEEWFKGNASSDEQAEFDAIAKRREIARAAKDWAAADAARDEAKARGIVLEDGPDGTRWRKA